MAAPPKGWYPQNPNICNMPYFHAKTVHPNSSKFVMMTHQGQTMKRVVDPTRHTKGQGPKNPFSECRSCYQYILTVREMKFGEHA